MANVQVNYDNFTSGNQSIKSIEFSLLPNIILHLERESETVVLSLKDADTDDIELSGTLDTETLNSLIKSLSLIRNQIDCNTTTTTTTTTTKKCGGKR